jgi:hypothetical protein
VPALAADVRMEIARPPPTAAVEIRNSRRLMIAAFMCSP